MSNDEYQHQSFQRKEPKDWLIITHIIDGREYRQFIHKDYWPEYQKDLKVYSDMMEGIERKYIYGKESL